MLQAQAVSVGVKGGILLTDALRHKPDESRNYTVGPTVEFKLPAKFAIETGFLYKRIGSSAGLLFGNGSGTVYRSRGNSFEIPVVGKYYIRRSAGWSPYLGLGVAMRRAWQTTQVTVTGPPNPFFGGNFRTSNLSSYGAGAVGAAGVQFRHGRWKVSPEFRYTRWSRESQVIPRNPNQVEFLVGISF